MQRERLARELAASVNRGGCRINPTLVGTSRVALALAILILAACGGGCGGGPPSTYTVGGTVSGLKGSGLVLANNGGVMLQFPIDDRIHIVNEVSEFTGDTLPARREGGFR